MTKINYAYLTGHFSAQVNCVMNGVEEVLGPICTGHLTDIGERFLKLCATNGLMVKGSFIWSKDTQVDLAQRLKCEAVRSQQPVHSTALAAAQPHMHAAYREHWVQLC